MAAVVQFTETNGAPAGTPSAISNMNFGSADVFDLVPGTHPIIRGTLSFKKYIQFEVTSMGGSTQVDSLGTYKVSGAYRTGELIYTNCPNNSNAFMLVSYATPTNGALTSNVFAIPSSPGPFLGIGGSSAGALTAPGVSNYWLLQTDTTGSTELGAVFQKVIGIQYNEF